MSLEMMLAVLKGFVQGNKPHRDVKPRETPEFLRRTYTPKAETRQLPTGSRAIETRVVTGPNLPTGNFTQSPIGNRGKRFI